MVEDYESVSANYFNTWTMNQSIVILGPAYPLRGGGMATFNERLARQFQQEGNEVIIYTFSLTIPFFSISRNLAVFRLKQPPADIDIRVQSIPSILSTGLRLATKSKIEARSADCALLAAFYGTLPRHHFTKGKKKQAHKNNLYCR